MDQPPTSHLLALPAEIRTQILALLLAARNVRHVEKDGKVRYHFVTNLFRVNKQLSLDAVQTFRHTNSFVVISTAWGETEEHVTSLAQVPVFMTGDRALQFPHYRVLGEVEVVPGNPFTAGPRSAFLICQEDLEAFCKMWYYLDLTHGFNSHLQLNIKVRDLPSVTDTTIRTKMSRSFQEQLLDPFKHVKGLDKIRVFGPIDNSVEEGLRRKNGQPCPTPEECLDECERLKNEGNKAIKLQEFERAQLLYEKANEAMHIIIKGRHRQIWGDMYFDKILTSGTFKGQDGNLIRMLLRIKLVSNMIEALLKLNQPEEAKFWGWRAINIVRERMGNYADRPRPAFPAAGAWGKVYYRTGRACQLLGEEDDARQLFRIAADWLPHDPAAQKARAETALRLG